MFTAKAFLFHIPQKMTIFTVQMRKRLLRNKNRRTLLSKSLTLSFHIACPHSHIPAEPTAILQPEAPAKTSETGQAVLGESSLLTKWLWKHLWLQKVPHPLLTNIWLFFFFNCTSLYSEQLNRSQCISAANFASAQQVTPRFLPLSLLQGHTFSCPFMSLGQLAEQNPNLPQVLLRIYRCGKLTP